MTYKALKHIEYKQTYGKSLNN